MFTSDSCDLAERFSMTMGLCQVIMVGTAQVAVAAPTTGENQRYDQWAAYRQSDGVVVFIAQTKRRDEKNPPLPALPLTGEQLAALAADKRFHLT